MSKILAQWEIDSLMSTFAQGDTPASNTPVVQAPTPTHQAERSIKLYDFRYPDKLSKDHVRALQYVHETFARITSSSLSSYLRSSTSVQLSSVEQVVYDEYVQQLANPTVVNVVELQPLAGRIIVELNLNLGLAMMDRIMGGAGQVSNRGEFTDIELALIRNLGSVLIAGLKESWALVADLQPVLADTVLSAEFVQAALPGDIATLLLLEVQTLGMSGMISICVPYPVIEPIMDKLSTRIWFSSPRKNAGENEQTKLEERLQSVVLPVHVELGSAEVTVADVLALTEGDVIRLDRAAEGDLVIEVGGLPRLLGRPGLLQGNRAVQVTGMIEALATADPTSTDAAA